MQGRHWCLLSSFATVKRGKLVKCKDISVVNHFKSEISLTSFFFGRWWGRDYRCDFPFPFLSACLCEQASLSLWGMTCLLVEGSSCALDLVCVVLPCPVIGSRLLAAACAGGLQPGRNPSVVSYGELSAMPSHAYYVTPTQLCDQVRLFNLDNVPSRCIFKIPTAYWTMLGLGGWRGKWSDYMKFGRSSLFFFFPCSHPSSY